LKVENAGPENAGACCHACVCSARVDAVTGMGKGHPLCTHQ